MTNTIAIWLGLIIIIIFALDHFVFELDLPHMVLRGIVMATNKIAFWR